MIMRHHATASRPGTPDTANEQRRILHGESFNVSVEEGLVTLSHPEWSLMGMGASVAEAEAALIVEALELREVMRAIPAESLNDAARAMKDFLGRISTN